MNKVKSIPFKMSEYLSTPKERALYIEEVMKDNDETLLLSALKDVADSMGISELSNQSGLPRATIYKALAKTGNPRFSSLTSILHALGLKITIQPEDKAA